MKKTPIPEELQDYLQALPGASQNNARSIVRSAFKRILEQGPAKAAFMLNQKYGFDFDYKGKVDSDWGNERSTEPLMYDGEPITDEELAKYL